MEERRKAVREPTLLGGEIAFNKRSSTMDCVVRNISPLGAKVTFGDGAIVPKDFDLIIPRKDRSFHARMIWRLMNAAGLAFMNDQAERPPVELAKRLHDVKAENEALRKRVEELSAAAE